MRQCKRSFYIIKDQGLRVLSRAAARRHNLLVHFYIDKDYDDSVIGIHPNDNTETIILKVKDLIEIIATHGNEVKVFEIN